MNMPHLSSYMIYKMVHNYSCSAIVRIFPVEQVGLLGQFHAPLTLYGTARRASDTCRNAIPSNQIQSYARPPLMGNFRCAGKNAKL